ncbi:DUF3289 family protein [Paenibacillus sp. PL91]|uniref:DUF3289 family protein n=1 Tax=Paenibacillus sp. PL91 TaxID=2729538 RepID=UPI00145F79B2|nr:DUF3289 family protein [Paenibacillus sp. PL91]
MNFIIIFSRKLLTRRIALRVIIYGLTITVNDTWGNTVSVKDFSVENNHFKGVMNVHLYDHFGLDQPDVEKMFVNLAGFRA